MQLDLLTTQLFDHIDTKTLLKQNRVLSFPSQHFYEKCFFKAKTAGCCLM